MEIIPLGDSALIVRVAENFPRDPEGALAAVLEARRRLQAAAIPGVLEYAPAYASLGVFFDPTKMPESVEPFADMKARIESALAKMRAGKIRRSAGHTVEIPVCYEGEFAPDLDAVASHTGLSPKEIIRRHSGAEYLVHCLGFAPGFGYLSGLPNELSTPRRASPRKQVPAGAVAIGGGQTGVYPSASPGGWNLIGRTPRALFDPAREPAALLATGMRVRFRTISRAQFDHETTR